MIALLGAIAGFGAIISVNSGLGYILPALIGLESMGVPSPGETALVLAAVLAGQGKLNIVIVIAIAAASAMLGDNIGYLLGRRFGREILTGRGPLQKQRVKAIAVGDRYFDKHGSKTVFIGRWIALIRFAVAWLAGINHMRFRTFFCWNALGGITWACAYGLAGYYGGNAIIHVMEKVGIVAAILVGVAIVGALVAVKWRERKAEQAIEAEVEAGPGAATEVDRAATEGEPAAASPSARKPEPES